MKLDQQLGVSHENLTKVGVGEARSRHGKREEMEENQRNCRATTI